MMRKPCVGVAVFCGAAVFFVGAASAPADDLVTLSGALYRDAHPVKIEPDGITWRYAEGLVKIDFADTPDNIRRAYHYDATKAAAYRDEQTRAQAQSTEATRRAVAEHDRYGREQARLAAAKASGEDATDAATVFRRATSPAASDSTRETAARMREQLDQRAAEAAANPDTLHLIHPLPGIFGPRPINPFMDTPNARDFAASLHHSPTGASGNFTPSTDDPNRATTLDQPIYLTRSYYDDVARSEAYARGASTTPAPHD